MDYLNDVPYSEFACLNAVAQRVIPVLIFTACFNYLCFLKNFQDQKSSNQNAKQKFKKQEAIFSRGRPESRSSSRGPTNHHCAPTSRHSSPETERATYQGQNGSSNRKGKGSRHLS